MAYKEKTIKAGDYIEIRKYHTYRYSPSISGIRRGKNKELTTNQQAQINERNAEDKLRWLLQENFKESDIHLVMTYKKQKRLDPEQSAKEVKNAIRRFSRVYKKAGIKFKWVLVTEYKSSAIHHHMVIPSIDIRLLIPKWTYGQLRPTYMYEDGGFAALAHYLVKETRRTFKEDQSPHKKRWYASINLRKPKITTKIIKYSSFSEIPRTRKGYTLESDTYQSGVTADGYAFVRYCLKKIAENRPKKKKQKSQKKNE